MRSASRESASSPNASAMKIVPLTTRPASTKAAKSSHVAHQTRASPRVAKSALKENATSSAPTMETAKTIAWSAKQESANPATMTPIVHHQKVPAIKAISAANPKHAHKAAL